MVVVEALDDVEEVCAYDAAQRGIMTRATELLSQPQHLTVIYGCKLAALEALKKSPQHQAFTGNL